jgi:RimJ/RimL family protein N-acetyltransferase
MDDCSLLLVEAGVIRGEDAAGLVIGTVLAVARTTAGAVASRPGDSHLARGERTTLTGCVSYLVDRRPAATAVPPGYELRTADADGWLAGRRPPEWEAAEWVDLLAGRLGPWAIVSDTDGVASVCHSARLATAGAEAGVHTAAAHRARGLARVATAAWTRQVWDRGIPLFYSHAEDNASSQRVAEGLGLRPLGRVWFVTRESEA